MNNAKTKTLTAGLMHGLVLENKADYKQTEFAKKLKLNGVFENSISVNGLSMRQPTHRYIPYLFPMSALTKEIEVKGERFVPIERIADIVEDVCFNEEYSQNQFWYEIINGIFRLSFDKSVRLNGWLIEHHFNVFNLSPDEFIEVNETNNPYK